MAKRSGLLAALDAHRGRDHQVERQRKQQKQAKKRKISIVINSENQSAVNWVKPQSQVDDDNWESEQSDTQLPKVNASGLLEDESDSDSSLTSEDKHDARPRNAHCERRDSLQAIPLSDIESLASEDKVDILPHQRLTINNICALQKAHNSFSLQFSMTEFSTHQTVTTTSPVMIPDVNDDLNRELVFYKQCMNAATDGRRLLSGEGAFFSRPNDYFAEMLKSDEHMGKVKQKIVDEAASKKASSEARRQRDLKKFGKQVQVAKLQERDKAKRDILKKVDLLKKKRKNNDIDKTNEESMFDVALEDTLNRRSPAKPLQSHGDRAAVRPKKGRKDEKFGFGGRKRFGKSNDATSTADMRGYSAKKMKYSKGGTARPGRSKRARLS